MTFASPAFLWALAAVSLPLLLHLVRQRRVRVVRWAAWRFLIQSQQRLRRRLRLEQMILAAIRALIIALIVLAFARPVILAGQAGGMIAGDGPVHAVIALDNSASMSYEREGRSDFDRARQAADRIIARTLRPGDAASVVLASASPDVIVKHPSHDLQGVSNAIRAARVSGHATDYSRVANACLQICEQSPLRRKEVYIVTDSQRSGFGQTPEPAAIETWRKLAQLARITWVQVGAESRPNVSVADPVFSRDYVTKGAPVRIEADITNRTDREVESAAVRLEVEGRTAGATSLRIARGETARAAFTHTFNRAGTSYGRIVLDRADGLVGDNSGWFAVHVRSALRLLVVGPTASTSTPPDTLYLATAMAPTGASQTGASRVNVTVRDRLGSSASWSNTLDVVVLAGPERLSDQEAFDLRQYVGSGGALLAFPSASGLGGLKALVGSDEQAIWRLNAAVLRRNALDQASLLDTASIAHPALDMFRSPDASDLNGAKFTRTFDLDMSVVGATERPRILMRFADGRPAIIESELYGGPAILCAFPAGVSGGDLPLKAAYVPLLHQLIAYLASIRTGDRMVTVGEEVGLPLTEQNNFGLADVVALSSWSAEGAPKPGAVLAADLKPHYGPPGEGLLCPGQDAPGIYLVRPSGSGIKDPSLAADVGDAFAVNLDPRETDLTSARHDLIRSHVGGIPMTFARDTDDLSRVVRTSRFGSELWPTLIVAALALLMVEGFLARAFGRRA